MSDPDGPRLGFDDAAALLARLGVTDTDIHQILEQTPTVQGDPNLRSLLQRCVVLVGRRLGTFDELRSPWPDLPAERGLVARWFWVHVYLAALPATREFHRQRGIPDDVAWATLADLGDKIAMYHRAHGVGGLDKQNWLTLHLRGVIYTLGRLQFNLMRDGAATALGVHIPATGPLDPSVIDDSLGRARGFFARHFPEHRIERGVCTSWLLDEQLAEYLASGSNIVRFQRRFELDATGYHGDDDIREFVVGRPHVAPADLPRGTTLERAIVAHLQAGRHWTVRTGRLPLP